MFAAAVKSPTLASSLWTASGSGTIRAVALAIVGACLLTLSAKIQVPFHPVPMTLQTLVVLLIGAAYGARLGMATVALYIAAGAVGLPVFGNTPPLAAGPLYLVGPTGGFLAGFVVAAGIVGAAAERGFDRSAWRLAIAMTIAIVALLSLGVAWLATMALLPSGAMGVGFARAFAAGVEPFLLGEMLKIAVAALAVPAAWRLLGRA